jgi:cytochrome c oxidase subunit 3/cytochrome o ubiquinol oxidase subunit 3/cytochrome c oxidase subunit I+III
MKDKGKLLVLVLISSEAFFFIALIVAYVYYRNFTNATDTVSANLDALRSGIFTLLLIASSFTLLWGKKALAKNRWETFKIAMGPLFCSV